MSNYKQQSLFEDDRKRTRRPFKRVRRTRSEGVEVYMRALQDIQMRMKRGEKINFKMVCRFFRIGNLSSKLLPKDLATADITIDYTAKWYNEVLSPYYIASNRASRNRKLAANFTLDDEQEQEQPTTNDQSVADIMMAELEKLVADFVTCLWNFFDNYNKES